MWVYDENWVVDTETQIRATYAEAGAPYDTARASVWNARCVSQAASGLMTRQAARWSTLNALRGELHLTALPVPIWAGEEVGPLRTDGLNILNDGTPFGTVPWMLIGYRMLDALAMHLYGIQPFDRSLDVPAELGFNTAVIGATCASGRGHVADLSPTLNPDLYDKLSECASIAQARGMRLWVYACCDCGFRMVNGQVISLNLTAAQQHDHWLKVCERLAGGYHIPAIANEWGNGNSADVQGFPAPTGCPLWVRGTAGEFADAPNGGTICGVEVKRRGDSEERFKMTADAASVEYHTLEPSGPQLQRPVVRVEDTFAAEADQPGGRRRSDPRLFTAVAACTFGTREFGSGGGMFGAEDSARAQPLGPHQRACAQAFVRTARNAFVA